MNFDSDSFNRFLHGGMRLQGFYNSVHQDNAIIATVKFVNTLGTN